MSIPHKAVINIELTCFKGNRVKERHPSKKVFRLLSSMRIVPVSSHLDG